MPTEAHRRAQNRLAAATVRRVRRLWELVDPYDLDGSFPVFADAVSGVVEGMRRRSSRVAAEYYSASRTGAKVPGVFDPVRVDDPNVGRLMRRLRTTGPAAVKAGMARGLTLEDAMRRGLVNSAAAAAREVLDAGRETVMVSSLRDPMSDGWARVGSGDECGFCRMLISNGAVHSSLETAGFSAHDNCRCQASPVFNGEWDGQERVEGLRGEFRQVTDGKRGKDAVTAYNTHVAAQRRAAAATAAGA